MKKFLKFLCLALLIVPVSFIFVACDNGDKTKKNNNVTPYEMERVERKEDPEVKEQKEEAHATINNLEFVNVPNYTAAENISAVFTDDAKSLIEATLDPDMFGSEMGEMLQTVIDMVKNDQLTLTANLEVADGNSRLSVLDGYVDDYEVDGNWFSTGAASSPYFGYVRNMLVQMNSSDMFKLIANMAIESDPSSVVVGTDEQAGNVVITIKLDKTINAVLKAITDNYKKPAGDLINALVSAVYGDDYTLGNLFAEINYQIKTNVDKTFGEIKTELNKVMGIDVVAFLRANSAMISDFMSYSMLEGGAQYSNGIFDMDAMLDTLFTDMADVKVSDFLKELDVDYSVVEGGLKEVLAAVKDEKRSLNDLFLYALTVVQTPAPEVDVSKQTVATRMATDPYEGMTDEQILAAIQAQIDQVMGLLNLDFTGSTYVVTLKYDETSKACNGIDAVLDLKTKFESEATLELGVKISFETTFSEVGTTQVSSQVAETVSQFYTNYNAVSVKLSELVAANENAQDVTINLNFCDYIGTQEIYGAFDGSEPTDLNLLYKLTASNGGAHSLTLTLSKTLVADVMELINSGENVYELRLLISVYKNGEEANVNLVVHVLDDLIEA